MDEVVFVDVSGVRVCVYVCVMSSLYVPSCVSLCASLCVSLCVDKASAVVGVLARRLLLLVC